MNIHRILGGAVTALALLLTACGGGGGGIGGSGGGGGGGIGGTGVAYGGITGFGSVWVNGVRYETDDASFRLDDDDVAQDDLRVGMVARIVGTGSTASQVVVSSSLKGRVEQAAADRLVVMGQTVQVDAATQFEDGVRPAVGDYVEVHGLAVSAGVIAAGYVERKSTLATPPFKVTGIVATQDAGAQTLTVGTLTVAYAGADTGDMGTGSWVGQLVEIKGTACSGNPVCGTLTAVDVEPAGPGIDDSPKAEVEGFVTTENLDGFSVAGLRVIVTAATVFEGGLPADVRVGTKVEAEGPVVDGVMTASKVEIDDSVEIEGNVLAVDGDRLTIAGLDGLVVQVTTFTELNGIASRSELRAGQHVQVEGRAAADGTVVATELEVDDADTRVELQGPVGSAADPSVTILGVAIDTAGLPDGAFRGEDDVVIGRAAFFAALAEGRLVKARGEFVGGVVVWDEFELED